LSDPTYDINIYLFYDYSSNITIQYLYI